MSLKSLEGVALEFKDVYPIGIDTFESDLIFLETTLKNIPGKSYDQELKYILKSVVGHSLGDKEKEEYLNGDAVFTIKYGFDLVRLRRALRDHVAIVNLAPNQYDLLQDIFNEIDDCFQVNFCEGFNQEPDIYLYDINDYRYLATSFVKFRQTSSPTQFKSSEPFFFPVLRKAASVTEGYNEKQFNSALVRLYYLFSNPPNQNDNNPPNQKKDTDNAPRLLDEPLVLYFIETREAISKINYSKETLLNNAIPLDQFDYIKRFVKLGVFGDFPTIRRTKCETKDILGGFDQLIVLFNMQVSLHIKRKEELRFAPIIEKHFVDALSDFQEFIEKTRDLLEERGYLTQSKKEFYDSFISQFEDNLELIKEDVQPAPSDVLPFQMDYASNLSILDSYFDLLPLSPYESLIVNHYMFELVNEFFRPIVVDPSDPMDTKLSLADWIIRVEPIQLDFLNPRTTQNQKRYSTNIIGTFRDADALYLYLPSDV
jgi:hypothetical protein